MKTIILAGGRGTRLGQQSETIPKPMVLIGGKPILWHIMKIYSSQGFNEFVLCLGEKAHVIKDYFSNYGSLYRDFTIDMTSGSVTYHNNHGEEKWNVTLVDTGLDTLKGGRIKRIERYLDSNTNMLTYGDGLCDVDLTKLLAFHTSHGKLVTITAVQHPSRFGELDRDGSRVMSFTEKPKHSKQYLNGGFMVFNKGMLDYLTEDRKCDFEIGVLDKLAKDDQIMAYTHNGNWECMDHDVDVFYLNDLWATGKAFWRPNE
jgi:glucose-1-phosphate cytidylyltransferase